MEQILAQNPKVTTWTANEKPYGYTDQWPTNLMLNNTKAPFDDKDVRWAISYFIDRDKVVQIGIRGDGSRPPLPLPNTPAIRPYFDAVKDLLKQYDTNELTRRRVRSSWRARGTRRARTACGRRAARS